MILKQTSSIKEDLLNAIWESWNHFNDKVKIIALNQ